MSVEERQVRALEDLARSAKRIAQLLEVINENFVKSVRKPGDTVTVQKAGG